MTKCLICSVGDVVNTGCFEACNNCSSVRFVVSDMYLETSIALLGTLYSNLSFNTEEDFNQSLVASIGVHLPMLKNSLVTYINVEETLESILTRVKGQSINLVIGGEPTRVTEEPRPLICTCGCGAFNMISASMLVCKQCDAKFKFDVDANIYRPYFVCDECGSIRHSEVDTMGLCFCEDGHAHLYDRRNDVFRRGIQ